MEIFSTKINLKTQIKDISQIAVILDNQNQTYFLYLQVSSPL
jgi:hypothetical protein